MKIFRVLLAVSVIFLFCRYLPAQDSTPPQGEGAVTEDDDTQELETFAPGMEGETALPDVPEAEDLTKETQPGAESSESAPSPEGTLSGAAPEVYSIVEGDTLWDVCSRFLGNPFEWPKLWSINQYITNAHFIHPGAKIVFRPGTEVSVPSMEITKGEVEPEAGTAEEPFEEKPKSAEKPKQAKIEEPKEFKIKLKSLSFITKKELDTAGTVTHSGEVKKMLTAGDNVYLKFKNPGSISISDKFVVFDTVGKVKHPRNGKTLGYQIVQKAVLKIVALDKNVVTASIIDAENTVSRGDKVIPYENPVVSLKPKTVDSEINGYIVGSEPEHKVIGQNEFAYVDMGLKRGVDDGTLLYVVRRGDGLVSSEDNKLPFVVVGKLLVVNAKENTSTVYVMDTTKELEIGDVVKTKY